MHGVGRMQPYIIIMRNVLDYVLFGIVPGRVPLIRARLKNISARDLY